MRDVTTFTGGEQASDDITVVVRISTDLKPYCLYVPRTFGFIGGFFVMGIVVTRVRAEFGVPGLVYQGNYSQIL